MRQFQEFPGHALIQTVYMRYAVPDFQDGAYVIDVHFDVVVFDLFFDYSRYFFWLHFHFSSVTSFITSD